MNTDNTKTPEIKIVVAKVKADPRKINFSFREVDPVEDAKTPDYDAKVLEATTEADKYRSHHKVKYEQPASHGFNSLNVLQPLWSRPWDQYALNMVGSLRPSYIRVVGQGQGFTLDACSWRVTVHLEEDDRTIREITQEVEVGLVGAKHGHGFSKYEQGDDPKPCVAFGNIRGIKKINIKDEWPHVPRILQ